MGHQTVVTAIEDRDQLPSAPGRRTQTVDVDRIKDKKQFQMSSPLKAAADAATDLSENDQEVIVIPKVKFNDPGSPAVSGVGTVSASFSWSAVHLAEYEPPQEDGKLPEYSIEYILEYQEVPAENGSSHGNGNHVQGKVQRSRGGDAWRIVYRGSDLAHQVSTLRPGRRYMFQLRCLPRVQLDNFELLPVQPSPAVEVATVPTPPHELQPPSLSNRARNALKLKWNPPEETGGLPILLYTLFMKPPPPSHEGTPDADGFVAVYSGDQRTHHIKGLRPGMRFTFRVQAANKLGSSPLSLCSVFTTQASVPGVIAPPQEVERTETSVSFEWQAPEDNGAAISGYVLELDDGAGDGFRLAYAGPAPFCTISGLRSGLTGRFRVRADNDEGRGNWSVPFTASTAATTPACPSVPTVIGANRNSVSLSWHPPEDDGGSMVELYELELLPKSAVAVEQLGREWLTVFRGPSCGGQAPALLPGCAYMCRVRAINAAGPGPYSAAVEVQAAPDAPYPPSAPEATAATSRSLTIAWQAPPHDGGTPVTSYRLEAALTHPPASDLHPSSSYNPRDTTPPTFHCLYSGPERTVSVEELPAGAHYLVRVSAINAQGGSPWSPTALLATRAGPPLPPPQLVVTATTSSSVALQWGAPDCQGAAVSSYQVEAAAPEGQAAAASREAAGDDASSTTSSSNGAAGSGSNGAAGSSSNGAPGSGSNGSSSSGSGTVAPRQQQQRYSVVYRGPALQCEAKGLEAHQEYLFRVRASNCAGAGPWSSEVRAITQPAAPSPPLGLHVTETTSTTIALAWAPPAADHGCPVTSYLLESAPASARAPKPAAAPAWQRAWQGPALCATLPALKPGRTLTLRVRALNARGASPPSDPLTAATLPAPPSAPDRVSVTHRAATSLRVRWDLPAADNGARVEWCVLELAGVDGAFRCVYRGPETSFKLQGLQPVTQYALRVAAVNAAGQGGWSPEEAVSTTTLPPPPPQDVDVAVEAAAEGGGEGGALTVRWDPPVAAPQCAKVLLYEVEAAEEGGEGCSWRQTGGHEGVCTLQGVPAGAAVAVRMRAVGVDGAGHSGWTAAVRVQMPGQRQLPVVAYGDADEASNAGGAASARKRGAKAKGKLKARGPAPRNSDSDDASSTTSHPNGTTTSRGPRPPAGTGARPVAVKPAAKLPPRKKALLSPKTWQFVQYFAVYVTLLVLVLFTVWLALDEYFRHRKRSRPFAMPSYGMH